MKNTQEQQLQWWPSCSKCISGIKTSTSIQQTYFIISTKLIHTFKFKDFKILPTPSMNPDLQTKHISNLQTSMEKWTDIEQYCWWVGWLMVSENFMLMGRLKKWWILWRNEEQDEGQENQEGTVKKTNNKCEKLICWCVGVKLLLSMFKFWGCIQKKQ
jgi:hypothetical protein